MKALVKQLEMKVKRMPSTEKAIFTVIATHLFPGMAPIEINQLFEMRTLAVRKQKQEMDESVLKDNFDHVFGAVTEKDAGEMKDIVLKSRTALEEQLKAAKASLAGVTTEDRGDIIDKNYAAMHLPPGATLGKDVKLHWRWIGEIPKRKKGDKIFTKAWQKTEGVSEAAALKCVLRKLWEWHASDNPKGVKLEHDFDVLFGA